MLFDVGQGQAQLQKIVRGLVAAGKFFIAFGENDRGTPIKEARAGVKKIAKAYAEAGVPENFSAFIEKDTGHVLSDKMWTYTKQFFAKHLI